jgi:hypothetical protein
MSEWKNEDDIKAELRAMTGELRKLREGLRDMVSPPPKNNPSRAFLHRQSWPSPVEQPPPREEPPPRARADDEARSRPKPPKRRKKTS